MAEDQDLETVQSPDSLSQLLPVATQVPSLRYLLLEVGGASLEELALFCVASRNESWDIK